MVPFRFQKGKEMSKDTEKFGAAKSVAFAEFLRILGLLKMSHYLGKTSIDPGRRAPDETLRFRVTAEIDIFELEGEIVVKCYDGEWRLYCAASRLEFGDEVYSPWFIPEKRETGIRTDRKNGPTIETEIFTETSSGKFTNRVILPWDA